MHLYRQLPGILMENQNCSLATVVAVRGSTPQKTGSSAVICGNQLLAGTIGGGFVEHSVIGLAEESVRTGKSKLYTFDLRGTVSEGSISICGGEMRILLDADPGKNRQAFESLCETLDRHKRGILITRAIIINGKEASIERFWMAEHEKEEINDKLKEFMDLLPIHLANTVTIELPGLFANFIPGTFKLISNSRTSDKEELVYAETLAPLPSLVIAGAGHIGRALTHLGRFLGFEVTVWDDREELAHQEQLPDAATILTGNAEDCLSRITVNRDTYLVIVTRGHSHDGEVLKRFIASDATYIGMIGSKAKVAQMKEHFLTQGWASPEQWEKVHTPIGLSIGSVTVEEIAVSIAAELIQVRNQQLKRNG